MAGLLLRVGAHYEFVNDLAQECVYRSLAQPLVSAYHRRAADLLSDQPESMAAHAHAAGEPGRAAQGWLLAGQAAMGRSAVEDAIGLYDRALAVGGGAAAPCAGAAGPCPGTGSLHGVRRSTDRHRRGPGPRQGRAGPTAGDGRPPCTRRRRTGGAAAADLRGGCAPRGRSAAGDRARRPGCRGRLHHPAGRARGEPAPARERARQGRGGPGTRTGVVLGGSDPVRARRREDRPRLPRRGRPAARGRGRAGAAAASAPVRLAAPVGRVRVVVRGRCRGRLGRGAGARRGGPRGQPEHRFQGLRRVLPRTPRLVRAARRRPRHRDRTWPHGGRRDLTGRPPLVVRRGRRAARRPPCSRRGRAQRPSPWPAADSPLPDRRRRKPGGCVASRRSP